ncbi:hypothetical protein MIND_00066800 [Mycena indigotica]|uniref:Uncharacterized protein n=1 Tax=Mycena indigotica TaxID=2126181 RepID=A0A8H6TB39_9AGAR|nr:uncharacterized protein MIND_00066800 [Mycena indigotica]KAF7315515.1 hypothetical protein MIND_00066800 [Mycena indigotica]
MASYNESEFEGGGLRHETRLMIVGIIHLDHGPSSGPDIPQNLGKRRENIRKHHVRKVYRRVHRAKKAPPDRPGKLEAVLAVEAHALEKLVPFAFVQNVDWRNQRHQHDECRNGRDIAKGVYERHVAPCEVAEDAPAQETPHCVGGKEAVHGVVDDGWVGGRLRAGGEVGGQMGVEVCLHTQVHCGDGIDAKEVEAMEVGGPPDDPKASQDQDSEGQREVDDNRNLGHAACPQ